MRSQYQRALYQLVSVAREQDLPQTVQSVWPLSQPVGMDWSRYYREFDEIDFIAGGGFGKVYKARHKLDGIFYAVKKITIKSITINRIMSHLAEVKTLASLNHTNIVPYKAAWLEPLMSDPGNSKLTDAENENTYTECDDLSESQAASFSRKINMNGEEVCSSNIHMSEISEESSMDFIQFERSETDGQSYSMTSAAICKYSASAQPAHINLNDTQPHVNLQWATLYIQMALCQWTLREWLDQRNVYDHFEQFYEYFLDKCQSNKSTRGALVAANNHIRESNVSETASKSHPSQIDVAHEIFKQLINGLGYIHTRGIVHHDIKPSNIFIGVEENGDLLIQLGDFGLACPLQDQHTTNVIGTPTYAAPEQLNGHCDPKVFIIKCPSSIINLI